MKILVAGIDHPQNVRAWSGILYHLSLALSRRFEVSYFGGRRHLGLLPHAFCERVTQAILPGKLRYRVEPSFLKTFGSLLQKTVLREKPDLVFSMFLEVAYLPPDIPVATVFDATFRQLDGYYDSFTNLCERSKRYSEVALQRGLDRTTLALPATEWARQSACVDYRFPSERTHVMPMGANLVDPPSREEALDAIARRMESSTIHFFFAGVDWQRKGGDTAVRIVQRLIDRGLEVRLHVAGCTPPPEVLARSFVIHHGYLSKSDPKQAAQLRDLFKTASFFILPSLAECYGCVFCEASAFGLPTISRDTGGIPGVVREGFNGHLLSTNQSEEAMADLIAELCADRDRYRRLALTSREEYETRLNWDTYAENFEKLIASLR